jgi:capsular polysaccharide export protein
MLPLPPDLYYYGFSWRKSRILKAFLPEVRLKKVSSLSALPDRASILLWGACVLNPHDAQRLHLIRVEDGFLRSIGLGAAMSKPVSWVFDDLGMYFDATQPSRLEHILLNNSFDDALLKRAEDLRKIIVLRQITKYNLASNNTRHNWKRPDTAQEVLLVVGQVEGDASIQTGSPVIKRNQDFLRQVRLDFPKAHIVYRPHPDVVDGWRHESTQASLYTELADSVSSEGSITELFAGVDAVCVMTSLAGFEALLRGKKVYCYGQPFYAGWGLTHDVYPINRRNKILSLNALVAGALIEYPRYRGLSQPIRLIEVEAAIDELISLRVKGYFLRWQNLFKFFLKH